MTRSFQRKGYSSNAEVGRKFEQLARKFFEKQGIDLPEEKPKIEIGFQEKKEHEFDWGNDKEKIVVECKSLTWTSGNLGAREAQMNQTMLFFYLVGDDYRKILALARHEHPETKETVGEYYIRNHRNLIPKGVEIWEIDEETEEGRRIYPI
ncbi:MAG: hypothetical protein GXO48_09810 [Chlorobi bacterium]|nr:hypothetical protein [Chlorobiota bacterium]